MINNKEEKTIAICSKLNLQFLTFFEFALQSYPQDTLENFYQNFLKSINCDQPNNPYPLINQGSILIHLYGMIVYPWEKFHNTLPTGLTLADIDKNEWGMFSIKNFPANKHYSTENSIEFEFFIKKIRNSISHGRFQIDNSLTFLFKDSDGTEIEFPKDDLIKFVLKLYYVYLSDWSFS